MIDRQPISSFKICARIYGHGGKKSNSAMMIVILSLLDLRCELRKYFVFFVSMLTEELEGGDFDR